MNHWAKDLIGLPWKIDGFGPDSYNCWGLIWFIYWNQFGIILPMYANISPRQQARATRAFEDAATSPEWMLLSGPVDGCVVGMSSHKLIHHVGVYLAVDGGVVLHACEGKGVLCQPIATLKAHGWNRLSFYKHSQWPAS